MSATPFHLSLLLRTCLEPADQELDVADVELEPLLRGIVEEARAAWPEITLPLDAYFRFLARHLPNGMDRTGRAEPFEPASSPPPASAPLCRVTGLRSLRTADMFLAAACIAGVPRALLIFDEQFLAAPNPTLLRMRFAPDVIEEATQLVRHRFFVGDGSSSRPKIIDYCGVGSLHGWVRAALVRTAIGLLRRAERVDTDPATLVAIASPENDLELDYLKRQYGADADDALREAFDGGLRARERNLLRQYFALGMGIDEIATFYCVHRVTAWRWLASAREELAERTRERLVERLAVAREEASSILRLLQSQLEVKLRGLLATPMETPVH